MTDKPEGLWDDAELVIYSCSADETPDYEPQTEWGKELGLTSFSLWAQYDNGSEVPIYSAAENGVWLSMSSEKYHPEPPEPVSDAFVEAVVNMVDEDVGEGWGDPTEEAWEAMRPVERVIWRSTMWSFLEMDSVEAAGVIDWCQKKIDGAEECGEGEQ